MSVCVRVPEEAFFFLRMSGVLSSHSLKYFKVLCVCASANAKQT